MTEFQWLCIRQRAYDKLTQEIDVSDRTSHSVFLAHQAALKKLDAMPYAEGGRK